MYDFSHVGHARTYIIFDMFVKYMRAQGYKVYYLQNITDIDDKIIHRAHKENTTAKKVAEKYEKEYYKDMEILGIDSVDKYARAGDYMEEIIRQIKKLMQKGYAYETENGVYFRVSKFKDYGKLSRQHLKKVKDIEEDPEKENHLDFSLWKKSKPGEPARKSPWGKGRPGWHIEDTAITHKEFKSPQYEIHGGARDLIFPHHEAEIAQIEAAYGKKPMVKFWMHTGFLQIKKEKMSKSLDNYITIRDALKDYSPETLRMFFTTRHYRSPINYDPDKLNEAQANEERLTEFWAKLFSGEFKDKNKKKNARIQTIQENFWANLKDDFNTPKATAELFKLVNLVYKTKKIGEADEKSIKSFLKKVNKIFNIVDENAVSAENKVPHEIKEMVARREELRRNKKFKEADELREKLRSRGYIIEDTEKGAKIKRK